MVVTGLAIAKAALTAIGIGGAGVAAVAVGYPHGLEVALQNVPGMTHAHSVLEGLWHSFPGRGGPGHYIDLSLWERNENTENVRVPVEDSLLISRCNNPA